VGSAPGTLVRAVHRDCYRELFQPSVCVGLLRAGALLVTGSIRLPENHGMCRRDGVRADAMSALFDLWKPRRAVVRAVLATGCLLYPSISRRQRTHGAVSHERHLRVWSYPWTIIRVRTGEYLQALESTSVKADIDPFAAFIAERVAWSITQAEMAKRGLSSERAQILMAHFRSAKLTIAAASAAKPRSRSAVRSPTFLQSDGETQRRAARLPSAWRCGRRTVERQHEALDPPRGADPNSVSASTKAFAAFCETA